MNSLFILLLCIFCFCESIPCNEQELHTPFNPDNCTEVGSITIDGAHIKDPSYNFNGLKGINRLTYGIFIQNFQIPIDLNVFFSDLEFIGEDINIVANSQLTSLVNLKISLSHGKKDCCSLTVFANHLLTELRLPQIKYVYNLQLHNNFIDFEHSFDLSSLELVLDGFEVSNENNMKNLNWMKKVWFIGGWMVIVSNFNLVSLEGLNQNLVIGSRKPLEPEKGGIKLIENIHFKNEVLEFI